MGCLLPMFYNKNGSHVNKLTTRREREYRMNQNTQDSLLKQLDDVLAFRDKLVSISAFKDPHDLTGVPWPEVRKGIAMATAAIERVGGHNSPYVRQIQEIDKTCKDLDLQYTATQLFGVVDALRTDIAAGYIRSVQELVHGTLFTDFLKMSQHLLEEGYKDAAAVIAGSSLEAHLRQMCFKHNMDVVVSTNSGSKPKKAERMNTDLSKTGAFSGLDQKNVTAWLDLRNKAAHGEYAKYTKEQVDLMVSGIQDFITRTPA